jgi:hypothetical protein
MMPDLKMIRLEEPHPGTASEELMNRKVHFWIVCDAADYIKDHGSDLQVKALRTLDLAYGNSRAAKDCFPARGAVESIAGFESMHTDSFDDLSLCLSALPWPIRRNITGFRSVKCTGANHFINPYPGQANVWSTVDGYSYRTSSRRGVDSVIMLVLSDLLGGFIDVHDSLALDRMKPFWTDGPEAWENNFGQPVRHTKFPPCSVLASMYYYRLILNHYQPMEVRGPNRYLAGLQLLGPVLHATTDACTPHHARPAFGLGHHVWENFVEARVYNGDLTLDPDLVTQILSESPCEPWYICQEGPMEGRFDVEKFVYELSVKTVNRLKSTAAMSWKQFWQAGADFWREYMTDSSMKDDGHYLYNLAIAGTVHTVVRSYTDLVNEGILCSDRGQLLNPDKLPELALAQRDLSVLPSRRRDIGGPPPEELRRTPLSMAKDLLGFSVIGTSNLQSLLDEVRPRLLKPSLNWREKLTVIGQLTKLEEALIDQYFRMESIAGDDFCPTTAADRGYLESDLSVHFGTATFRLPSRDEYNDPDRLAEYTDLADNHVRMAVRLTLTQALASLKYFQKKFAYKQTVVERLDNIIPVLNRIRDLALSDFDEQTLLNALPRRVSKVEKFGSVERTIRTAIESMRSHVRNVVVS